MTVSFFGHRDAPDSLYPKIRKTIESLIIGDGATHFLVGNNGAFDSMVIKALSELKKIHVAIDVCIALAYMPTKKDDIDYAFNTVFPEPAALSIPRFAISARNRWMISKSDAVITYVARSFGGAANAKKYAASQKKRVIEIGEHKS